MYNFSELNKIPLSKIWLSKIWKNEASDFTP